MDERSDRSHHRLHNFSMPSLKWGHQKLLRSIKLDPSIYSSDSDDSHFQIQSHLSNLACPNRSAADRLQKLPPLPIRADDQIEKIREKLLVHLRTVVKVVEEDLEGQGAEDKEFSEKIPWNLRTRRAACDAPAKTSAEEGETPRLDENHASQMDIRPKSLRLRGLAPPKIEEKKELPKFSISLSREEIEEDFWGITGSKPSRRPRKRARAVQKKLDETFPGLWLSNITLDSYKISEIPESKKK